MKPYYEHGGVTIYHGDCREVLPEIAVGTIDLVFTSPPYNLGNTSGGGFAGVRVGHYSDAAGMRKRGGGGKWNGGALADGYGVHADNMPHAEYVAWQREILCECWRKLGPAGAIFYNHKPRILNGEVVTPLAYNPELPIRQIVVWARAGGVNFSPSFYVPTHEWIVIFARPDFRLKSKGASGVGDVWSIPQEHDNPHPAPFPLALPARAIETVAPSIVLDPFAGSGTTLRAARDAGVRAIGIEIEERYCEIAAKRLAQEVLFPVGT
jgi:site-specific DNA-methyltransferase (adenine-specific)